MEVHASSLRHITTCEGGMKRIGSLVVLVLVAVMAQAQVKFGAGPQLGISFASAPEPADKVYGFGYGFGAHGDVSVSKYFSARLNFDYHIFGASEDEIAKLGWSYQNQAIQNVSSEGGTVTVIGITASVIGKLPLGGSVTPYAIAGLGYGISNTGDLTIRGVIGNQPLEGTIESDSQSGFSLNFGAGAEFAISKTVSLYGEIKYVLILISEETDAQTGQKSGGNVSHLPIMFGMTYWF
jgi:opacity protein-like surface antigen